MAETCSHIFIIGFMGAGKTSVAHKLAMMTSLSLVDLDQRIVTLHHRKIQEIFAEDGEEGFRALETWTLKTLALEPRSIVSCGGGIVSKPENIRIMRQMGTILFLDVEFDDAVERITHPETRPLLADIEAARKLYEQRYPLYLDAADIVEKTKGSNAVTVASKCKSALMRRGIL